MIDFVYGNKPSVGTVSDLIARLPTLDDVHTALSLCPDFGDLYRYFSQNILPPSDNAAQKLLIDVPRYVFEEGVLHHLSHHAQNAYTEPSLLSGSYAFRQLCIPESLRPSIPIQLHDHNCHIGFDRLYTTTRTLFYWKGMFYFLKNNVVTCVECQRSKLPAHSTPVPVQPLPVSLPLTRYHFDHH
jgi:hypothetical protein